MGFMGRCSDSRPRLCGGATLHSAAPSFSVTPWLEIRMNRTQLGLSSLLPDVFIPQIRVIADKAGHHLNAFGIVKHNELHAALAEEIFCA